jgi:hypothetical protein
MRLFGILATTILLQGLSDLRRLAFPASFINIVYMTVSITSANLWWRST